MVAFKMFVMSCVVIMAIPSVRVSDASSNQFWCGLTGVKKCVDNLTACNCTSQSEIYCPSRKNCTSQASYNESECWDNATSSCSLVTTTTNMLANGTTKASIVATATNIHTKGTNQATILETTANGTIKVSHTTPLLLKSSIATVPTMTSKPTKLYSLNTDYLPIIIAVAAGFGGFIIFVCCMCAVHSWWLKRNKFTDVNSTPLSKIEKRRRKQELLEARMREAEEQGQRKEPSKFDMGYTKPQKVNERALANYDWARTSYLPGMLEPTSQEPNPSGSIPKLICDDDDDSDFDDPSQLGDDNFAYERGKESPSMSSLFSPMDELEPQPQEPVVVEPEIFDSLAEIPRPPPDGDMVDSTAPPPSQDYYKLMGRF